MRARTSVGALALALAPYESGTYGRVDKSAGLFSSAEMSHSRVERDGGLGLYEDGGSPFTPAKRRR